MSSRGVCAHACLLEPPHEPVARGPCGWLAARVAWQRRRPHMRPQRKDAHSANALRICKQAGRQAWGTASCRRRHRVERACRRLPQANHAAAWRLTRWQAGSPGLMGGCMQGSGGCPHLHARDLCCQHADALAHAQAVRHLRSSTPMPHAQSLRAQSHSRLSKQYASCMQAGSLRANGRQRNGNAHGCVSRARVLYYMLPCRHAPLQAAACSSHASSHARMHSGRAAWPCILPAWAAG